MLYSAMGSQMLVLQCHLQRQFLPWELLSPEYGAKRPKHVNGTAAQSSKRASHLEFSDWIYSCTTLSYFDFLWLCLLRI